MEPTPQTRVPTNVSSAIAASGVDPVDGDRFFGMNAMDITATKVRLMERLGEAFGISMEDHADARGFGEAIRAVAEKLQVSPEGRQLLGKVEKDLGLTELGVSIDTLIGAIIDPAGHDAERLDAALRDQVDAPDEDEAEALLTEKLARMGLDEVGLYGL